jgi:NAD(P)-dependent dehydrogenase (short-subunit alcohol dehydrogenase family)
VNGGTTVNESARAQTRAERVAIITGAGGGLGGAVARLLAAAGTYRLSLVDNRSDALDAIVADVRSMGADAAGLVVNLGSAAEAERVVPDTIARVGRVDALVNAAAILHRREFDEATPEDFDTIFHINTQAPFLLARAAIPDMATRGWGRIVNVTSTGVYEGGFTMTSALYEMSKGAVAVLTKMLSRHGAPHGVLINTVCPGGMRTGMLLSETSPELVAKAEREMIPLHRIADPAEIGQIVVWLISDLNTYATGAEFDVTGGLALH